MNKTRVIIEILISILIIFTTIEAILNANDSFDLNYFTYFVCVIYYIGLFIVTKDKKRFILNYPLFTLALFPVVLFRLLFVISVAIRLIIYVFRLGMKVLVRSVFLFLLINVIFWSLMLPLIEPETFVDPYTSVYYIITTITTVGYGDITPKSDLGRLVAMYLMVIGTLIWAFIVALFTRHFVNRATMDTNTKANVRKHNLKYRKHLNQKAASKLIVANILKTFKHKECLAYEAIHNEIDVKALENNMKCYYPKWNKAQKTMNFDITPKKNTLIIVPGVVFDENGNRIGYGGGYYDRYLNDHPGIKVGVIYDELLLPKIPTNKKDIKMDYIITPEKVIKL